VHMLPWPHREAFTPLAQVCATVYARVTPQGSFVTVDWRGDSSNL